MGGGAGWAGGLGLVIFFSIKKNCIGCIGGGAARRSEFILQRIQI